MLFGVLCLPGDQSHLFAQPTINPLAFCICWAGLLGRAVFPPWNEGPNFGSYKAREFQKNINFIEYAKVFDCVGHNKLWKIRKEMGIPDHLPAS